MPAHFHIPGIVQTFHVNQLLIMMMEKHPEAFRPETDIGSIYGEFPSSMWNGGRVVGGGIGEEDMRYIIGEINGKGISLRYTFTNPLIGKAHLDDAHCNRCLKLADRADRLNAVILVSPELEKYIRRKYPNYRIVSSTCKQIRDFDKLCEELEKDYACVVLDYNFNNQFELLEKLPHKERIEILCNPLCPPACPRRGKHYNYLGRLQIAFSEHLKKNGTSRGFRFSEDFECPHTEKSIYDITQHATHVSPEDIYEKYIPMGFQNFKIEGRSTNLLNVIETYMYYLVKPEHRDEIRLNFLRLMEANKLLRLED
ncbi:MAG: hypothetical protein IKS42_02925 [Oscillospiraceae bacterium]|nr:hypothetical protein [Oscillospiraceae bacterium]